MLSIEKTMKKMLDELREDYLNGNKKALSEILLLIKKDIFNLIDNQGLSIKMTKKVVENALGIKIKDDTFYKWVNRQRKKAISSPVVKENELKGANAPKREKIASTSLKSNNKGAKAPDNPNPNKGGQNESIDEIMKKDVDLSKYL